MFEKFRETPEYKHYRSVFEEELERCISHDSRLSSLTFLDVMKDAELKCLFYEFVSENYNSFPTRFWDDVDAMRASPDSINRLEKQLQICADYFSSQKGPMLGVMLDIDRGLTQQIAEAFRATRPVDRYVLPSVTQLPSTLFV